MTIRAAFVSILTMIVLVPFLTMGGQQSQGDPKLTEVWEPVPRVVTPGAGAAPPSDARVLFDGKDLAQWQHTNGVAARWTVAAGAFTVVKGTGDLRTKEAFGDCQLHVEWRSPQPVQGEGQERGNSGIFLQGRYEVQVLDSFDNRTYSNGQAASIYKQHIPLVNASRGPGEWQTYDIFFRAPRFSESGSLLQSGYITVLHNGILVQDHVEIDGATVFIGTPRYQKHGPKEPLVLQDHGNPVSFRNIWLREL